MCCGGWWGEGRNPANTYHWRVWGALPVSGPHWVCPHSHVCAFLVYTALAPGRSAGDLSKAGPGLRALSWSKLLRFRFLRAPQRHRLGWVCVLCPSQVLAAQVTGCLVSSLSPGGGCVSSPAQSQLLSPGGGVSHHLPSPSCCPQVHHESIISGMLCLLRGAYLWLRPSWQMSTIQDPRKTWLATGSLLTV